MNTIALRLRAATILCLMYCALSIPASAAWRYDPAAGVISDDAAWTTKVTRAIATVNGLPVTNLTISAWNKGAGAFDLTSFAADTGCHVVAVGSKAFGNTAASTACQTITSFTGRVACSSSLAQISTS